jgi:hypothetical protein
MAARRLPRRPVQLRGPRQQIGAPGDVRGVALERQLLIDVDQLGEPFQRHPQALDLGQRVGVAGVGRQHLSPGRQRRALRLQLVLLQVRDARQQRRRGRAVQDLPLDVEDRRQAGPGAARLVHRLEDLGDALTVLRDRDQLLEQAARALVVGRRLDDLLQQVQRAGVVFQVPRA